jgi:hypothetical protein
MAELAPGGGGPNRAFIVIAIGLVGLLVLGLIAVGGIFIIPRLFQAAAPPPTVRLALTTPTRVPTFTPLPTPTELPPATATLVLGGATPVAPLGGATSVAGTVTATTVFTGTPGTGTPIGGLPETGVGEDLLLLAGGVVLVLIIFAARRARATGAA